MADNCSSCLDAPYTCGCGVVVRAGDGHPECGWYGFWMCECGHCTLHHNQWWDCDFASGMGCDRCDCDDSRTPLSEVI